MVNEVDEEEILRELNQFGGKKVSNEEEEASTQEQRRRTSGGEVNHLETILVESQETFMRISSAIRSLLNHNNAFSSSSSSNEASRKIGMFSSELQNILKMSEQGSQIWQKKSNKTSHPVENLTDKCLKLNTKLENKQSEIDALAHEK